MTDHNNTTLLPQHAALLAASTVSDAVAAQRGYRSVTNVEELLSLGFTDFQCRVPGLLAPIHDAWGENGGYSYRPDNPRVDLKKNKPIKYENPQDRALILDVPTSALAHLGDPMVPLWITESARKADALASHGFCAVSVIGCHGWHATNAFGGKTALADWHEVAFKGKVLGKEVKREVNLCFDSDQAVNPNVWNGVNGLADYVRRRGASVWFACIPHPAEGKWGIDDFFGAGYGADDIRNSRIRVLAPPPDPKQAKGSPDYLAGILSAAQLDKISFPPVRYVVDGLISEGGTLFTGPPKVGKSFLLAQLALAISCGGRFLGREVEQGDVLMLGLEDSWSRLQDRLRTMMMGDAQPDNLLIQTEWALLDEGGADLMRRWADEHPKARMIAIDILEKIRPLERRGESIYRQEYGLMAGIKRIADETKVPIVVLHHNNKLKPDDPFENVSGTTGLAGAADTVMVMRRSGAGESSIHVRGRDVEESNLDLRFDGAQELWDIKPGEHEADTMLTPERQEVLELLRRRGPMLPVDISGALGKERSNVRSLLTRMARTQMILVRNHCYYVPGVEQTPESPGGQVIFPWG